MYFSSSYVYIKDMENKNEGLKAIFVKVNVIFGYTYSGWAFQNLF